MSCCNCASLFPQGVNLAKVIEAGDFICCALQRKTNSKVAQARGDGLWFRKETTLVSVFLPCCCCMLPDVLPCIQKWIISSSDTDDCNPNAVFNVSRSGRTSVFCSFTVHFCPVFLHTINIPGRIRWLSPVCDNCDNYFPGELTTKTRNWLDIYALAHVWAHCCLIHVKPNTCDDELITKKMKNPLCKTLVHFISVKAFPKSAFGKSIGEK